ncbi:MAG: division/cell wall cluster transcriptional repressor MraZ [Zavarzinella sp.]
MLLTGTHPRTLDDKNRLTLPKRVREVMGEPTILYVTPGPDKSLWIFTEAELEKLSQKLDELPATNAEAKLFRRLYFAQTETVDVDKTGRILVPERLNKFADLGKEVVLIGVRDHLELWHAGRWQAFNDENLDTFDQAAEQAFNARNSRI